MASRLKGAKNPNWKGGRIIDPRGYVLIRVGKDHPLADCRGYAYEHRLVAASSAGRDLVEGEQVHHRDEVKGRNAPDNLEICRSLADHRARHRSATSRLKLPSEENPVVLCDCGCGGSFLRFDSSNRPRRFVSGHNLRSRHG